MIKPGLTFDEYSKLSNEEKRKAFERLANRIAIAYPECLEKSINKDASDIVKEIAEMTDVDVNRPNIKRLEKRIKSL